MKRILGFVMAVLMFMSMLSVSVMPVAAAQPADDGFVLFDGAIVPPIVVSNDDYTQVLRAIDDFKTDILNVTGVAPNVVNSAPAGPAIIVGSVDKSPIIGQVIASGKFPEAASLSGKWEAFAIKVIENPLPGVTKALVIAGSDKRGAIFGVYEMSQRIGVSPYYWWADVPIKHQNSVVLPNDFLYEEGESSVKYRGIFPNDEFQLWEWSAKLRNDTDSPGQLNPETYKKIFELLLRLKMNTIWPGMHEQGDEFYKWTDKGPFAPGGVPLNGKAADDYGIVVGTTHCEPLLTAPADEEWNVWALRNFGKYDAAGLPVYDYTVNPKALMAYWREHVEMTKDYEGIYNLGMRGRHDGEMAFSGLGSNPSLEARAGVLQRIIDDQRVMLQEVIGKPIDQIPQAIVPYLEIGQYYNAGVNIPEDVILMWAEDNHGQVRQLLNEKESQRSGLGGVYYHVSYSGTPTNYLWVNSTSNVHMYEELRRAYDTNSKSYWILNVGDVKPHEVAMEFFAEVGRDINKYDSKNIDAFYEKISKRDYLVNDSTAAEIGDIMEEYLQLAFARRPEFMGRTSINGAEQFSLVNYGEEAQIYIDRMNAVYERAKAVHDSLDADRKEPFYEMVYYAIRAAKFQSEWINYQQMQNLTVTQGRYRSAASYEELSKYAYQMIQNDLFYFNKLMVGGKWDGIMASVTAGRIGPGMQPSDLTYQALPAPMNALGSVCEGQRTGSEEVTLRFSSLTDDRRFIDVFTRDADLKAYTITPSDNFIIPAKTSGTVNIEERIWVSIDWSKLTPGVHTGTITVTGEGLTKTYNISAEKFDLSDQKYTGADYIWANGYVAIEAEHFSNSTKVGSDEWSLVKRYGRIGDSMVVLPHATARTARIESDYRKNAARLEYNVYFSEPGEYQVTLYRNSRLNEGNYADGTAKSMNAAISIDSAEPSASDPDQFFRGQRSVFRDGTVSTYVDAWRRMAMVHCDKLTMNLTIPSAGVHTINIFKVDPSFSFDRFVIAPSADAIATNSYFGPPESYNTKYAVYPAEYGKRPNLESIPQPEEVAASRFSFGATYVNYINVSNTRLYNGSNGYGWDQVTTQQTATTGGTGINARDREYQYGNEPRTFKAKLPAEGKYSVALTVGNRGESPVRDVAGMNVSANGEPKLTDINVTSGESQEKFFVTELSGTTEMSITFTGSPWAVTAIEITPYYEAETEGNEGYFLVLPDVSSQGTGYIEAEAALEQSAYAWIEPGNQGTRWVETAGVSGTAMFHGPNANVVYSNNQAGFDMAPKLNYKVLFNEPGLYRVWVLRKKISTNDDAIMVGLDGVYQFRHEGDPTYHGGFEGIPRWVQTGTATGSASAGTIQINDASQPHTITIAGCEDGYVIDKICLLRISGVSSLSYWIPWPGLHSAVMSRSLAEIEPPITPEPPTESFFNESFDEYEFGGFTTNAFWQTYGTGPNVMDIVSDPDKDGNKLLRIGKPVSGGAIGLYNRFPLGLSGKFTIETRVKRSGVSAEWGMYTYQDDTFNIVSPQTSIGQMASMSMAANGVLNTHRTRNAATAYRVGTTQAGVWKTVAIVVDMAEGTFDYYVDSEQMLENAELRTWSEGSLFDRLQFYTSVNPADTLYVDYIKVYEGDYNRTEPYIIDYTKELTIGYAANILVTAGNPVEGMFAEVNVNDVAYKTNFSKAGTALLKVPARIDETALTLRLMSGSDLLDSKVIRMKELPANIWTASAMVSGTDIKVIFAANVVPGSNEYTATLNGKAAVAVQDGADSIMLKNVLFNDDENIINISGVKFPDFFPSYSFTFTVYHIDKP